ncbi:hypothetical protein [Pseudonocardia sp. TMWB2A]|uniref:hypothetical protein n=1 Tax=Pseudonocardia sp. TMWB2A TaxID=687430 RepID=UPI00307DD634
MANAIDSKGLLWSYKASPTQESLDRIPLERLENRRKSGIMGVPSMMLRQYIKAIGRPVRKGDLIAANAPEQG